MQREKVRYKSEN